MKCHFFTKRLEWNHRNITRLSVSAWRATIECKPAPTPSREALPAAASRAVQDIGFRVNPINP